VKKLYRRHLAGMNKRENPVIAGKMPAVPHSSDIFSHVPIPIAGYPQPKATGGIFVREPSYNIYAARANPANKDSNV